MRGLGETARSRRARDLGVRRIAQEVRELEAPVWVVTSDRALRERVEAHVDRILGGGSFARELLAA